MINGLINVNKESGMTSHDVVFKLRKILKTKKIGHSGSLDKEGSGVLVLGVNKGTKILEYLLNSKKVYGAQLVLFARSNTEDIYGSEIQKDKMTLENKEYIESAEFLRDLKREFNNFLNQDYEQIPPMYSSIKINGKKLYQYELKGESVTRVPIKRHIYGGSIDSEVYFQDGNYMVDFTLEVSKGTYIRTFCVDLGKKLSLNAIMGNIKRLGIGSFKIEESLTIGEIEERVNNGTLEDSIKDYSFALKSMYPFMEIDESEYTALFNGRKNEIKFEEKRLLNSTFLKDKEINQNGIIICTRNNSAISICSINEEGYLKVEKNL